MPILSTGTELYNRLVSFTGADGYDTSKVAGWIDTALSDFPDEAFTPTSHDFTTITAGTPVALPADFSSVVAWRIDGVPYNHADEITLTEDDYVVFPYDLDEITLVYYKFQDVYTDLATALPVRHPFRSLILDFLIAKYYDSEGEGDIEEERIANKYHRSYETKLAKQLAYIENRDSDGPVVTKDAMYKPSRYHSQMSPEEDDI